MLVVRASEYNALQNAEKAHPERCINLPRPGYSGFEIESYKRDFYSVEMLDRNTLYRNNNFRTLCGGIPSRQTHVYYEPWQAPYYTMPDRCNTLANSELCRPYLSRDRDSIYCEPYQRAFFFSDGVIVQNKETSIQIPSHSANRQLYGFHVVKLSSAEAEAYMNRSLEGRASSVAEASMKFTKNMQEKWSQMSDKARIRFIAVFSAIVIAVVSAAIGLGIYMSPANQIVRCIRERDYEKASHIYYEKYYRGNEDESKLAEKLEKLIKEIKADFIEQKSTYDDAVNQLNAIERFSSDYLSDTIMEARAFLYDLNESFEAYERGLKELENEDYVAAIYDLNSVIPDDPHYKKSREYFEKAADAYRSQKRDEAAVYYNDGDVLSAMSVIRDALEVLPSDKELSGIMDEYSRKFKNDKFNEAAELAGEYKYPEAIGVLKSLIDVIGEDDETINVIDKYADTFERQVAKESNRLFSLRKYSDAIEYARSGYEQLSDSVFLSGLCDYISEQYPIEFDGSSSNSRAYSHIDGSVKDIKGKKFSGKNLSRLTAYNDGWGSIVSGYVSYENTRYTKLFGTVAVEECGENSDAVFEIKDQDGVVLFTKNISSKTSSFKIDNLDISNCDKVEVRLNYSNGSVDVILSGFIMYDKTNLDDFIDQYDYSVGYYKGITSLQEQSDDEENYGYDYD